MDSKFLSDLLKLVLLVIQKNYQSFQSLIEMVNLWYSDSESIVLLASSSISTFNKNLRQIQLLRTTISLCWLYNLTISVSSFSLFIDSISSLLAYWPESIWPRPTQLSFDIELFQSQSLEKEDRLLLWN